MRWTWTRESATRAPRHRASEAEAVNGVVPGARPGTGAPSGAPEDPDSGSAVVEFIGLGLLLLIPIIYLVVTVARVQAGSFAVVAAAEQAGQAISVLEAKDLNRTGIHDVAAVAAQDHGFDPSELTVTVDCSDGTCTSPGAVARVHATITVQLPGMPGFVTADVASLSADVSVVAGRYS